MRGQFSTCIVRDVRIFQYWIQNAHPLVEWIIMRWTQWWFSKTIMSLNAYLGYRWLFIYNKRNIVLFLVISLKETIRYSPLWIPLDLFFYHRMYSIFIDLFSVMSSLTFPLRIRHSSDDIIHVHDTAYLIKSDKAEHILKIKLPSLTYWRDGKYIYNTLWFSRHGTKYYYNFIFIW